MHRHASLLVLAGLMTATLHAQTPQVPPPAAPTAAPRVTPSTAQPAPPPTAAPTPATLPPPPVPGWTQARPVQTPPPAAPTQTTPPAAGLPVMPVLTPAPSTPRGQPGQRAGAAPGAATPLPAAPRAESAPTQNVRVDLTITDGTGARNTDAAAVKVVTMLVADGRQGRIRSSNNVRTPDGEGRLILINIDAIPMVRADGRIQLILTIEYTPDLPQTAATSPRPSSINESLTVLVADGKSTLISQSADPATARKVSVEVTATIVK